MPANLKHIVLVDDNETTSFLNNRLLGRLAVDFLALYSKLPQSVQDKTVMAVLTTSMHGADTARVAQYPNVEYLTKPLTEEKMQKLLAKRFK